MNLERLSEEDKIEKIEKKEFNASLAERDLKAAKDNFNDKNYDWALSIAYNAVLQAARALMFSLGYRAKGKNQHKTVFEFLETLELDQDLADYFDSIKAAPVIRLIISSGLVDLLSFMPTISPCLRTIILSTNSYICCIL